MHLLESISGAKRDQCNIEGKTSFSIDCKSVDLGSLHEIRAANVEALSDIRLYRDLVNYLGAAQIYLKDNQLLDRHLVPEDVKERLLGHWGTVPGINLVYAMCNYFIVRDDLNMLLVTGPGHGAPANLSNVWAEGSLGEFYPDYRVNREGAANLIRAFSMPGGFPSHVNAETPGSIHEGGELGYALSVAYGAAFDHPDLIVPCIVGDGEAETGPTAAAWHANKYIDPKESGAVLPILHVNGYKICEPTIFGSMTSEELVALFTGYGYQVKIVDGFGGMNDLKGTPEDWDRMDLDADLFGAFEWALSEIRTIQNRARSGNPIRQPRYPMIILRSPKGWTGIREVDGKLVEGSYRSHQVPAKNARENPDHLQKLEDWFRSYKPQDLFAVNPDGSLIISEFLRRFCPRGERRMGAHPLTCTLRDDGSKGVITQALDLPPLGDYETEVSPDAITLASSTTMLGKFLRDVIQQNPHSFRIFSPDELESNKLHAVFDVTHRNFQWPYNEGHDDHMCHNDGRRVIEILSEHTCEGFMQGYALTGRYALFPSYEAFLGIIATMVVQYQKFLKMMCEVSSWRGPYPSMTFLETSTLWRQEHNGFSHQNPGFVGTVLNMKSSCARVYMPPDANTLISTMRHCLRSHNYVQLVVAPKHDMLQIFTMEEAHNHCRAGAGIVSRFSTEGGVNPDVVLVGIGGETTMEVIAAADILAHDAPDLRVRVVNVTDLMILEEKSSHPHGLTHEMFEALFTKDRRVIWNYHGFPNDLKQLLFDRRRTERFTILGYNEEGTTTTPFDMHVCNKTDRFTLARLAIEAAAERGNEKIAVLATELALKYEYILREHSKYILKHGVDSPDIQEYPHRLVYSDSFRLQKK